MHTPLTSRPRRPIRVLAAMALTALTATGFGIATISGSAGAAPPTGDHSEPVWINGHVRAVNLLFTDDARATRRQPGFLVGPQDPDHPQAPAVQDDLTTPDLDETEPPHDHVLRPIAYGQRATCRPFAVLAVPDSDLTDRVHTRDTGLAYEINLGEGWTPLITADAVEAGLANGLLVLQDVGFGDITCWTSP